MPVDQFLVPASRAVGIHVFGQHGLSCMADTDKA